MTTKEKVQWLLKENKDREALILLAEEIDGIKGSMVYHDKT